MVSKTNSKKFSWGVDNVGGLDILLSLLSYLLIMPFGTYDTPKPPTIPTFLQFLKTVGKGVEGKTKFAVDVIWLPGKFDNVTLQTHAFRYVCDSNHPLYNAIKDYCECIHTDIDCERIELIIASVQNKQVSVFESPKKMGKWEKLGTNAFKFKPY